MNVILLEKIGRLGNLGDKVTVKAGYARNFLIPRRKAVPANAVNTAKFEERRAELEQQAVTSLRNAETRAAALTGMLVQISARAADEGRLYGSLGTRDLAAAVSKQGVALEKSEIRLPNGPIRQLGEHEIMIQLHSDINVTIKVMVNAEA